MRRACVFKNGSTTNGILISFKTLDELISAASAAFDIKVEKVFTDRGEEIDNKKLIFRNDLIFVSAGEPFISAGEPDYDTPEEKLSHKDLIVSYYEMKLKSCIFYLSEAANFIRLGSDDKDDNDDDDSSPQSIDASQSQPEATTSQIEAQTDMLIDELKKKYDEDMHRAKTDTEYQIEELSQMQHAIEELKELKIDDPLSKLINEEPFPY